MKTKEPREKRMVPWKIPTVPNEKAIEKQTSSLLERAGNYKIISEDHYSVSWILVGELDAAMKIVKETFDPFCKGLDKLHDMACDLRDRFYKPLKTAKEKLLDDRVEYRQQQEKIRRAAEAKLAVGLQKEQQKDLEKQARAAERKGEKDVANLLWDQAEAVPLPVIKSEPVVPKQEGSVIRKRWIYTIVNPAAVQRQYCTPDPKLIRPVVEALGPACGIDGLEIREDTKEYSRSVNE